MIAVDEMSAGQYTIRIRFPFSPPAPFASFAALAGFTSADFVPVNREIRTVHPAQVASAALFRMHHVRWMIALRIEGARKLQHVRRTKLNAKPTGFTPLNDDRNTPFCHEIPHLGVTITPVFQLRRM